MKLIHILTIATLGILLFSGCARKRIVMSPSDIAQKQNNNWASHSNVKEDVSIDDLETISTIKPPQVPSSQISIDTPVQKRMERISFPISEYKQLSKNGTGTVKGKIYLQNAYEKRVLGKNTRLYLNPITSYSKQWYNESYIGGYKMENADERLFNYLKFTMSNSAGEFAFYGVPEGEYYLIGTVTCSDECGYDIAKNIRIAKRVSIDNNKISRQDVSRLID